MESNTQKQDIDFQPEAKEYSYSSASEEKIKFKKNIKNNFILGLTVIILIFLIALIIAGIFYINQQPANKLDKNANTPKLNFTQLSNQASDAQMLEYNKRVISKNIPVNDPQVSNEFYGILSGFDKNNIQLVTYSGIKNFPLANNLEVLNQTSATKSASTQEETLSFNAIDKNTLLNKAQFGKLLQISLSTNSKSIQTIYLKQ